MPSATLPTDYQSFIASSRYARFLESEGRREHWDETIARYFDYFEDDLNRRHSYKVPATLRSELQDAVLNLHVMPSMRALMTKPQPKIEDDGPDRVGPPNFAALPAGAKPEMIFATKRVYSLNVNMPNLNSSTGSWILNFSELRSNPDAPRVTSVDRAMYVVPKMPPDENTPPPTVRSALP